MTTVDNLILDNCTADLVCGPLAIGWIGNDVVTTNKDSDWHLGDVLERDKFGCTLVHIRVELVKLGGPLLEAVHFNVLSEEQEGAHRSSRRVVSSVDHKAVLIVPIGVTCH